MSETLKEFRVKETFNYIKIFLEVHILNALSGLRKNKNI